MPNCVTRSKMDFVQSFQSGLTLSHIYKNQLSKLNSSSSLTTGKALAQKNFNVQNANFDGPHSCHNLWRLRYAYVASYFSPNCFPPSSPIFCKDVKQHLSRILDYTFLLNCRKCCLSWGVPGTSVSFSFRNLKFLTSKKHHYIRERKKLIVKNIFS